MQPRGRCLPSLSRLGWPLSWLARAPAFTAAALAALPQDGWLTNGGNLANQR
jgi:hypothetical protein